MIKEYVLFLTLFFMPFSCSTEISDILQMEMSNPDSFTNKFGMEFIKIKAGTFMMGSPENEIGRYWDEKQHEVTLTRSFYMQTTEVTQEQWVAIMENNPSEFYKCGDKCPVESVYWDDVQEFIRRLNSSSDLSLPQVGSYSLPTEAQWEYAARAGKETPFPIGSVPTPEPQNDYECLPAENLHIFGWFCYNSDLKGDSNDPEYCGDSLAIHENAPCPGSHPVAAKEPNEWGLYDMHGNVYELCMDWYAEYPVEKVTDPVVDQKLYPDSEENYKVIRGGSWSTNAAFCRSAHRGSIYTDEAGPQPDLGFRLVYGPNQH